MPEFYQLLSRHYDDLFPAEPEIVEFLIRIFHGACQEFNQSEQPPLIDAACGTGNYTDALSRRGLRCAGFDASREMIEIAREKGKQGSFETRDLQELSQMEPGAACGLFCIGNSLPHLSSMETVRAFFTHAYYAIRKGGQLVVQTVNFARFAGTPDAELPPVIAPRITMNRSYRETPEPGKVIFHADVVTHNGERASGETALLAITSAELSQAAADAGFSDIKLFGSYGGARYDQEQSFLLVMTATR